MENANTSSTYKEEWFMKFNPDDRFLSGQAYMFVKRLMDLGLVVISSPFWLALIGMVSLLIAVTSPGAPVIFTQLRTGRGGKRFRMYKFRTMVPDAEALKQRYAHLNELQWPDFKITYDPRVTSVVRILRKTSLDE